jgi:hypothetical protein
MDWTQILRRPFITPSLIAALMITIRIFAAFVNYIVKKRRRRKEERARGEARRAKRKTHSDPTSPGNA